MIIDMCESVQSYTNCKKSEMTINWINCYNWSKFNSMEIQKAIF
jgi:hypothetical protein